MLQDLFFLSVPLAFFALTWRLVRFAARLERGEKGVEKS